MAQYKFEIGDVVHISTTEKDGTVIDRSPCPDCGLGAPAGCGHDWYRIEKEDGKQIMRSELALKLVCRSTQTQDRRQVHSGRQERNRVAEMNEAYELLHGKPGPYGRRIFF